MQPCFYDKENLISPAGGYFYTLATKMTPPGGEIRRYHMQKKNFRIALTQYSGSG